MSSYSSPHCQYQQKNQSQETIALLFPSGMTDRYLHTHVLAASPSILHKAYSTLSSSSSPFLGAQDTSHAVLSTSTNPAASGQDAGTFAWMLLGCRAQQLQQPPPWTVERRESKNRELLQAQRKKSQEIPITGETQVLRQEGAQCWTLCGQRTHRRGG